MVCERKVVSLLSFVLMLLGVSLKWLVMLISLFRFLVCDLVLLWLFFL